MEECVYMTNRFIGEKGSVRCWVFREKCKKCGNGMMGKPVDEKTGKVKTRAKEYACGECGYIVEKEEYEDSLSANISYTCDKCGNSGELQMAFRRNKVKRFNDEKGKEEKVDALVFECGKCKEKMYVTKKMK